jgi:hypothetical protein
LRNAKDSGSVSTGKGMPWTMYPPKVSARLEGNFDMGTSDYSVDFIDLLVYLHPSPTGSGVEFEEKLIS